MGGLGGGHFAKARGSARPGGPPSRANGVAWCKRHFLARGNCPFRDTRSLLVGKEPSLYSRAYGLSSAACMPRHGRPPQVRAPTRCTAFKASVPVAQRIATPARLPPAAPPALPATPYQAAPVSRSLHAPPTVPAAAPPPPVTPAWRGTSSTLVLAIVRAPTAPLQAAAAVTTAQTTATSAHQG